MKILPTLFAAAVLSISTPSEAQSATMGFIGSRRGIPNFVHYGAGAAAQNARKKGDTEDFNITLMLTIFGCTVAFSAIVAIHEHRNKIARERQNRDR